MKILFEISHPAHVHQFKHVIWNLRNAGHEVKIVAREKDVALQLLESYKLDYEKIGKSYGSLVQKAYGLLKTDYKLFKIAKEFKPDIFVSRGSPYSAHVSYLMRKPHIAFWDTECAVLNDLLSYKFTDVICTPMCFRGNIDPQKHIKYNGYKELAYLHPKYFNADPVVLEEIGISKDEKFIIMRFISWTAHHDIGLRGIKRGSELELVKSLEQYGRVYITSERKLSGKLEKYRISILPEKIHSLLYYAQLYIGEGGTMAVEAAVLGTPSIHVESTSSGIATGELSGNFLELRNKYGLLYFYPDQNQALEKAINILENRNSKRKWKKKRKKLLEDKIDVTAWMTDFIERYPESFYEYKRCSE